MGNRPHGLAGDQHGMAAVLISAFEWSRNAGRWKPDAPVAVHLGGLGNAPGRARTRRRRTE